MLDSGASAVVAWMITDEVSASTRRDWPPLGALHRITRGSSSEGWEPVPRVVPNTAVLGGAGTHLSLLCLVASSCLWARLAVSVASDIKCICDPTCLVFRLAQGSQPRPTGASSLAAAALRSGKTGLSVSPAQYHAGKQCSSGSVSLSEMRCRILISRRWRRGVA